MIDANILYKAYLASIKGSKWKESSQKFMLDFLQKIFLLQDMLQKQTYYPSYENTFILHERGKVRHITCIQPSDRIVRHALCDDVLMPEIIKRLIYDNGSSIKGKGLGFSRNRFDIHIHEYCQKHKSNKGYILFGDFSKFYDNIDHKIAKQQLEDLYPNDEYLEWILNIIFKNFQIDVSYMSDEEYSKCLSTIFNKLEYNKIPTELKTGEKWMEKSINIGDQISQVIGIYYPNQIDTYVKTVRSQHYYGRYMDDFYIISESKEKLEDLLFNIEKIATSLKIFLNKKKTCIVKLDNPFTYLQLRYYVTPSGHITKRLNSDRVKAMRKKLRALSISNVELNSIQEMFRSWMGSYYKLLPNQTRLELITLFEELYKCKIQIKKGKMIFIR